MNHVNSPRPILVHGLPDARAALAAAVAEGRALRLASAPGAGSYAGGGWFRAVIDAARREFPGVEVTAVLDCGDQPGAALAALRAGVTDIALAGPEDVLDRVRTIAEAQGARLHPPVKDGLDLRGAGDPVSLCRDWLSGYFEIERAAVAKPLVRGYQGRSSAKSEREKGT